MVLQPPADAALRRSTGFAGGLSPLMPLNTLGLHTIKPRSEFVDLRRGNSECPVDIARCLKEELQPKVEAPDDSQGVIRSEELDQDPAIRRLTNMALSQGCAVTVSIHAEQYCGTLIPIGAMPCGVKVKIL